MSLEIDPLIGHWYNDLEKGRFEVVAIDESSATVEIQLMDGELGEIDLETWYDSDIQPATPPEDWSASLEDLESEDLDEALQVNGFAFHSTWDDIEADY